MSELSARVSFATGWDTSNLASALFYNQCSRLQPKFARICARYMCSRVFDAVKSLPHSSKSLEVHAKGFLDFLITKQKQLLNRLSTCGHLPQSDPIPLRRPTEFPTTSVDLKIATHKGAKSLDQPPNPYHIPTHDRHNQNPQFLYRGAHRPRQIHPC